MSTAMNSNESYCTFTLAGDMTAGGLPSEAEIRKNLEENDPKVSHFTFCCKQIWRGGSLLTFSYSATASMRFS
jgi:hypothetical protein